MPLGRVSCRGFPALVHILHSLLALLQLYSVTSTILVNPTIIYLSLPTDTEEVETEADGQSPEDTGSAASAVGAGSIQSNR